MNMASSFFYGSPTSERRRPLSLISAARVQPSATMIADESTC
jgi:hypothetical protein